MSLKVELQLEPRVEEWLCELAAKSGMTVEAFLARLVENALPFPLTPALTGEAWQRVFRAYVASHEPSPTRVDDSRESIYAGRGE